MRLLVVVGLAACGRVGFDARTASDGGRERDAATDAHASDVGTDGPITTAITHAGVFATRHPGAGGTDTFSVSARAAGDTVVMQIGCGWSTTAPSTVSLTAPGWTFVALDTVHATADIATEQLVAVAPDTNPVSITISWPSPCEIGTAVLADEFAGVKAIDTEVSSTGAGNCTATTATGTDGDTVWAACFSAFSSATLGAGYQMGADDGGGDIAEYKITTDPKMTAEVATFSNGSEFIEDLILLATQ